jgi:mRNA interferase MazF
LDDFQAAFTTGLTDALPLFRLPVEPNEKNGQGAVSRLMVDKLTTVLKAKIGWHRSAALTILCG